MVIRSFCLSDYVKVSSLFERVFSEECYSETKQAFARQLSWDSELVLVAEQDGEVVGSIIGTIHNEDGVLYRIAVDEYERNQGIGTSLIESLNQKFTQRNVKRVVVSMDQHNEAVKGLYEKLGWDMSQVARPTNRLKIVSG